MIKYKIIGTYFFVHNVGLIDIIILSKYDE